MRQLKYSIANERKVLKAVLLGRLHQLLCELFQLKIRFNHDYCFWESYLMDNRIIQLLIQEIIETGEYTLEGIAYQIHIPVEIIHDLACGINREFSITPWARVVDLYLQVKPDIAKVLMDKLLEFKNDNHNAISTLLTNN